MFLHLDLHTKLLNFTYSYTLRHVYYIYRLSFKKEQVMYNYIFTLTNYLYCTSNVLQYFIFFVFILHILCCVSFSYLLQNLFCFHNKIITIHISNLVIF